MPNPKAAMLVIGDEILSGRTRDSNAHHLAGRLDAHGIELCEVRVVHDRRDAIVAAIRALSPAHDHVFTSGGIGPTHDDISAESIAAAFDVPISVRDDARAILAAHYARREIEMNEARLRMARIPDGATLIDNSVSAAPGFTLRNVHVMAGVPKIFEAMLDALLPTLAGGAAPVMRHLQIERGEGDVADALAGIARDNPAVSIGSYPTTQDGRPVVQIVLRGAEAAALDRAAEAFRAQFPEVSG